MRFPEVILLSIGAAICYGIAHDIVTAQISFEFFSTGYRRVIFSEHPVVLALVWGVLDYWWMGVLLGCTIGLAARMPTGAGAKIDARHLIRPLAVLLFTTAMIATITGFIGWCLARNNAITLYEHWPTASQVSPDRHDRFIACTVAWGASWVVLFWGGVWLTVATGDRLQSREVHSRTTDSEAAP